MKKNVLLTIVCLCIWVWRASAAEPPYNAVKAASSPVVDADTSDACWSKVPWKSIDQTWIGSPVTAADFKGKFKVVWTPDRLYFLALITDDKLYVNYPGNCNNIHNYDCLEIFIDEDHSGGDHQYNFNAFAYHMAANGDVCDNCTDKQMHSFTGDVTVKFATLANGLYCWEVSAMIFSDAYVYGSNNTPLVLTPNKILGMSVAYNDNDNGTQRESMFGSAIINETDKNVSWINASYFGSLQLVEDSTLNPPTTIAMETGWNLVGYPYAVSAEIDKALASIWSEVLVVKDFEAFYEKTQLPAYNSLTKLEWGKAYMVKVKSNCVLSW